MIGVGTTGNQAFDDDIKAEATLYFGRQRFDARLEPRTGSGTVHKDPFIIHYPALLKIMTYASTERGMIDILPDAGRSPDQSHIFLHGKSLNEFVAILKEALTIYGAGQVMNKYIHGTIVVTFGF